MEKITDSERAEYEANMGVLEIIRQAGEPSCTVTVTNSHLFAAGDFVTIGSWPHWMYVLHLPEFAREFCRWICAKFGKKIGPELFKIEAVN